MNIDKAIAFKITIEGQEVMAGIMGVNRKPNGELPNDDELAKAILKAAIDRGDVKQTEGVAAVELMTSTDPDTDVFMDMMQMALEAMPEHVERFSGNGKKLGTVKDAPTANFTSDGDFLKQVGISGGLDN